MNGMSDKKIRINKRLVELSICSRRRADELIKEGRVNINNKKAFLGDLVDANDDIYIDNKKIKNIANKVLYAYNKPIGVVCTESKFEKSRRVCDEIKKLGIKERVFTIGRLDKNSTGLILLTNDGDFARDMTKFGNDHEKEYEVIVNKDIDTKFISKMEKGVRLSELNKTTLPCKIVIKNKNKFFITIKQGLNRQIRRMCTELGYKVLELKRIRIDNFKLGNMKVGSIKKIIYNILIVSILISNFQFANAAEYIGADLVTNESGPGLDTGIEGPFKINHNIENNSNTWQVNNMISTVSSIAKKDPRIIEGKDGWFFLKNSEFLLNLGNSDVVLESFYSRVMHKLLLCREMYVKNKEDFVFMICPEKNIIYKEYLPSGEYEKVVEVNRRIDGLVSYLRENSDLKIVYPKENISKISKYCQTYYKQDSHWNYLAGYIGTYELIKAINPSEYTMKQAYEYDLIAGTRHMEGDLCYYDGSEVEYYLDGSTNVERDVAYVTVDPTDNKQPIRIVSNKPKDNRKVFFIRDSFTNSMMPPLEEYFAEESFLYIINNESFSEEFLTGDVFVIEIVDRNLAIIEKTLDRLITKEYLK